MATATSARPMWTRSQSSASSNFPASSCSGVVLFATPEPLRSRVTGVKRLLPSISFTVFGLALTMIRKGVILRTLCFWLAAGVLLSFSVLAYCEGKKRSPQPQIIVFVKGQVTRLSANSAVSTSLRILCEQALTTARPGDLMSRIVLPNEIVALKSRQIVVEIIYPRPRNFHFSDARKAVTLDHLLIQFAPPPAYADPTSKNKPVFIYTGVETYSPGIYRGTDAIAIRLREQLRKVGLRN